LSVSGSTQPREDNWGATWIESSGSGLENWDLRPWGSIALTRRHPLSAKVAFRNDYVLEIRCYFLHSAAAPSRLGPYSLLNTSFRNSLSLFQLL
jgi:hypothetical protein